MSTAESIGLLPGFGWLTDYSFWVTLAIAWAITPLGHLLVGLIGESRWVPISPGKQFLSFFPGDLFLGLMTAGLLVKAQQLQEGQSWYNSTAWHISALSGALIVAIALTWQEYRAGIYPKRAVLSPTKIYHNGLLYVGYGYVIVTALVAVLFGTALQWVDGAIMLPGLVWAFLVFKDSTTTVKNIIRAAHAHTAGWRPIWARRK